MRLIHKYTRFFIVGGLFVLMIHFLSKGHSFLPALGPLLSFNEGVFKNASQKTYENLTLRFAELDEPVSVIFDPNGVPHIFAKNQKDLFFAQGYVTAKFRLWQMDLSTRAAAGKISEVLGERARRIDEFFVKIGLRKASSESFELVKEDRELMEMISSYTAGINAFVSPLSYKDRPVEYKITQSKPELFSEDRVIQLLKIMSFNLAARSYDLALTEILQHLGRERTADLFPDFYSPEMGKNFDVFFHGLNGETANRKSQAFKPYISQFKKFPDFLLPFHTDGSNSWLVPKTLSASGFNSLSNDTHLSLKAPSVWFEIRLYVPGQINVYGVSFPGAPLVALGFNPQFAWGATNGTIDVLDWFEVEFKDEKSDEYLVDGRWQKAVTRKEKIVVKGQGSHDVEITHTDFGPVLHREGKLGLTIRWTAHEKSNDIRVFFELNKARSVKEARQALTKYFTPIQNFSLADKNEIALVTAGIYPERRYGEGRVVGDGRFSKNNWRGFKNATDQLHSGGDRILSSANQRPRGSEFPDYLGWDFAEPYRAQRIFERLHSDEALSNEALMAMQNESYNQLAHQFFQIVQRDLLTRMITEPHKKTFEVLRAWDLQDDPDGLSSTLFFSWFSQIEKALWEKEFSFQSKTYFPKKSRTLIELKRKKDSNTDEFYDFLSDNFSLAVEALKNADLKDWKWGTFQPTVFSHVTLFPGFESAKITPPGSRYSLNANRGVHGGAWRLHVQMSDPIQAWTQIPGSIEGNPLSPHYSDNIKEWAQGKFKSVYFMSEHELKDQSRAAYKLEVQ